MHHQRPKVNLPLLEILGLSALLHVVVILLVGGITIYQHFRADDVDFESITPEEPIRLEKLQYKVSVQKSKQGGSAASSMARITTPDLADIKIPDLSVDLESLKLASNLGKMNSTFGTGRGGRGNGLGIRGTGLGGGKGMGGRGDGGSIGFGLSSVNFFGIKDKGERVLFIIDASKYMLEDHKGGVYAYDIVKEEISKMVNNLNVHTMFNVMAYSGKQLNMFKKEMVTADQTNKESLSRWIEPINRERYRGAGGNNYKPTSLVEPMGENVTQFARAIQAGLEQDVDTVFVMLSGWQWMGLELGRKDLQAWYAKRGWTQEDEATWNVNVMKAKQWLAKENAARKSRGMAPRVVHWIGQIVREQFPGAKLKRAPNFTDEEVMRHLSNVYQRYYKKRNAPPLHVALFLGADQSKDDREATRIHPLAKKFRGKMKVISGLKGLKNVTKRDKDEKYASRNKR